MRPFLRELVFTTLLGAVVAASIGRNRDVFINSEPDFQKALLVVEKAAEQPGNIDYETFCLSRGRDSLKLRCQIKEVPDVALFVCLRATELCVNITTRVDDVLLGLGNSGIKVMQYSNDSYIGGLNCGEPGNPNTRCYGYLVEWLSVDQAQEASLRSNIYIGTIPTLVESIKSYQVTQEALSLTADDLGKILNYTHDQGTGFYSRICGLQGFFMKKGGFSIFDPDDIRIVSSLDYFCHDEYIYPTTEMVVKSLKQMIVDLRPSNSSLAWLKSPGKNN
ncbi:uncharacterized protein LOC114538475 [Dendronephthya gigantea]|uniref:uncharacterized protein LOC114538475 n=1 Tax=Dendronephthya gigantea TaxID=151771 RepID=UPI00106C02E4|nr:uncharacterized protein LOC114538475 [Dendronephthya gigantea]